MLASWDELSPYSRLLNIDGMEPRQYQISIARSIYNGDSTLVILPTGLGKTLIAALAMARALHQGKKAIFLAPTKPLSEQHFSTMRKLLNVGTDAMVLLTGSMQRKKRIEVEQQAKVIVGTPQTVANDLKRAALSLDNVGLVVFDECHRAVGKYSYTYIANECKLRGIQVVGLTASPGSDKRKISVLVDTLGIRNIEVRTSTDMDVAPYVMQKDTSVIYVEKSGTVNAIASLLKPVIDEHLQALYSNGLSPFKNFEHMPKGRLLEIGDYIMKLEARNYRFMAIFHYAYVLHLAHAYDLITTEGIAPFLGYMKGLDEKAEKSRNVRSILSNSSVVAARKIASQAEERGEEHPKMAALVSLLNGNLKGESVIVFAQYRSTIKKIVSLLSSNDIKAVAFVGKKEGVTQAHQQQTISEFKDSLFRVLVTTSIGEEGLDIPAVDAVVFYEPIPSEIRNIQRKGRAGRLKYGKVFILVTLGTRDEAYLMISRIKEKRMYDIIMRMKDKLSALPSASRQQKLS
ncbi:MAG: DEAD/DEAH box helicase [Candidatus Marsarchaeota archaeon]|jgi:Fanconi anemia group M protein|nr:DEAD/DEAH box helicase [Candidatus Marsarchaeota archaeon]MCL5419112.1 DEAD/DEAH box helicase [Candidatus Marsarchaeota archaeon]